jgi:hypothetical protein
MWLLLIQGETGIKLFIYCFVSRVQLRGTEVGNGRTFE